MSVEFKKVSLLSFQFLGFRAWGKNETLILKNHIVIRLSVKTFSQEGVEYRTRIHTKSTAYCLFCEFL